MLSSTHVICQFLDVTLKQVKLRHSKQNRMFENGIVPYGGFGSCTQVRLIHFIIKMSGSTNNITKPEGVRNVPQAEVNLGIFNGSLRES